MSSLISCTTQLKSNEEIVREVLESGLLKKCVDMQFSKLAKTDPGKLQFKNDLFQDMVIILYEYDPKKLNNAYQHNHMNALITRILLNNLYSTTSAFYRNYIKLQHRTIFTLEGYDRQNNEPEDDDPEEDKTAIREAILPPENRYDVD